MPIDRPIALAAGVLQPFGIKHTDMAVPVADQSGLLQLTRPQGLRCFAAPPTSAPRTPQGSRKSVRESVVAAFNKFAQSLFAVAIKL